MEEKWETVGFDKGKSNEKHFAVKVCKYNYKPLLTMHLYCYIIIIRSYCHSLLHAVRDKNNERKNKANTLSVPKIKKSRSMSPKDQHEKNENDSKPHNNPAKEKNPKRRSIPVTQPRKPKLKSIELELANLNLEKLVQTLEQSQENFPGSKVIWFKSVSSKRFSLKCPAEFNIFFPSISDFFLFECESLSGNRSCFHR